MFTKYESGAEVDISVVKRVEAGAEVSAGGAYTVKSGAEEQVWPDVQLLSLTWKTATTGSLESATEWGDATVMTSLNDGGVLQFAADGSWNNPTIEFDYHGFFFYMPNGQLVAQSAGTLYAYGKLANGNEESFSVTGVNTYDEGGAQPFSYSFTNGDYVQIGFKLLWANWNVSAASSPTYAVEISNILIDGQKYLTDPADDYDYGDT